MGRPRRRSGREKDDMGEMEKSAWRVGNWEVLGAILTSVHNLKLKGIDLLSLCSRKIRNEASTRFWDDIWIGDQSLKSKFPRIFLLDNNRDCYVANRVPFHDWSAVLRRHPRGGVESSHLEALQAAIGNVVLTDQLSLNKLPSRVNLDLKGIDVGLLLCPICQEDVESVNHIFFSCEMAKALWDLFAKWWELDIPFCDNISDWFTWLDSLKVSNKVRSFIEGVANVVGDAERVWFVVEDDLESGETDDENK
ncbi:RNA-directed DNA polymerase, eukaryota, reverse transcriptase zinc-binding domain protein [Tanacetum coccineum]